MKETFGPNNPKLQRRSSRKLLCTFAAIARRYLARTAPVALAQSLPPFLVKASLAAFTALSTSSAVAAGIAPVPQMMLQLSSQLHQEVSYNWEDVQGQSPGHSLIHNLTSQVEGFVFINHRLRFYLQFHMGLMDCHEILEGKRISLLAKN